MTKNSITVGKRRDVLIKLGVGVEKFLLHKKSSFPLYISWVNVTKSAFSCGFGHIYWRNSYWKTSFFVQCLKTALYSEWENEHRLNKRLIPMRFSHGDLLQLKSKRCHTKSRLSGMYKRQTTISGWLFTLSNTNTVDISK